MHLCDPYYQGCLPRIIPFSWKSRQYLIWDHEFTCRILCLLSSLRNLPFWFWLPTSTLGLSRLYVTRSSGVTEGSGEKDNNRDENIIDVGLNALKTNNIQINHHL
jgi:hypothetical protein